MANDMWATCSFISRWNKAHMCCHKSVRWLVFHSLLTGFGLVDLYELGKTTTFVSQHHHLQRTSSNAVNRCFCGLIYNISRWKSIVLLHPYTMPENSWRLQWNQLLAGAHTDDVWTLIIPQTGGKAAGPRWLDHFMPLPGSIPVPPSAHWDDKNVDLWVLVRVLGPFDGCPHKCLWVWRNATEPRFLFSPFCASLSWINRDLLTREHKQVDRPDKRISIVVDGMYELLPHYSSMTSCWYSQFWASYDSSEVWKLPNMCSLEWHKCRPLE